MESKAINLKNIDMKDWVEYSIKLLNDENSEVDPFTKGWALKSLESRKKELAPLFNECALKGIDLSKLCPELNNEWNEIVMTIRKVNSKFETNTKTVSKQLPFAYNECLINTQYKNMENLTVQQEEKIKLKAKLIVQNFIKSYGENPEDYNEVFYNKKGNIGLNVVSYLEDLSFELLCINTNK